MYEYDLVIVGGGPAGLAAALGAKEMGVTNIIILEREGRLGGILNQCIHNGFGLHFFKEELTGPEYCERFIKKVMEENIEYKINTMVVDIDINRAVTAINSIDGVFQIKAAAIILAMGCREKPRGAINIPGSRCAGIYTAGTAQKYVNMDGLLPGKSVVVLGSGDIGLIMARRMTLEGAKVKGVIELMPFSTGLKRNIVQCLEDYGIPIKYSHTISNIYGKERLEGVEICAVDENRKPIIGSEEYVECDTLLLSVGLIPENELSKLAMVDLSSITGGAIVGNSMETSVPGIFACGNVLHVHDLVDNVSKESYIAGAAAAKFLNGSLKGGEIINIEAGEGIRYTVPSYINIVNVNADENIEVLFRVTNIFVNCFISVYIDGNRIIHIKKRIFTPGEMESVMITKNKIEKLGICKKIVIKVEKE